VAEVSDDREICIERQGGHLVALKDDDLVDLGKPGVETLRSRPKVWLLRIPGRSPGVRRAHGEGR
jgi:hypothetical protein